MMTSKPRRPTEEAAFICAAFQSTERFAVASGSTCDHLREALQRIDVQRSAANARTSQVSSARVAFL